MNKKTELLKIRRDLGGTDGIIYLMFCGRETYVAKIVDPLLKARIFGSSQAVNTAFNRLKGKGGYLIRLRKVKKSGERGRPPDFYAANLNPIFTTLKHLFNIDISQEEKFEKYVETLFEKISVLNDVFPEAYAAFAEEEDGTISYKDMRWYNILDIYFISAFAHLYSPKMEIENVLEKTLEEWYGKAGKMKLLFTFFMPSGIKALQKDMGITQRVNIPSITENDKIFLLLAAGVLALEDLGLSSIRKVLFETLRSQLSDGKSC